MAKVRIKPEKLIPLGGVFSIIEKFGSMLSPAIDSALGQRCRSIIGYQFSEIVRSLMSVYFCGGSCVEDITSQLVRHLSYHPTFHTRSSDTILRAIKKLTKGNISYTSDQGKTYNFNTADELNTLLINALVSVGELKEVEEYDVDSDHQFLEAEKHDTKPTYKKPLDYRPGVYIIGDKIVYIKSSDGNTNMRLHQADTYKRFFALLESQNVRVNRFRVDCGSYSEETVSEIEKHCKHFYIHANQYSSLYNDIFALRGWKTKKIDSIQFELDSILVEKWEGRCCRFITQGQRRNSDDLDLWEGGYTYRCILTNDCKSSTRNTIEFYNLHGGEEHIFDDVNNGFDWSRFPKSSMVENIVFPLPTALIHNFYKAIMSRLGTKAFGLKRTSRIKAFAFRFISTPAKWIMTARQCVLNICTENRAYAEPFKTEFG